MKKYTMMEISVICVKAEDLLTLSSGQILGQGDEISIDFKDLK